MFCIMLNYESYICLVVQCVSADVESGRLHVALSVLCVCVCFKCLPVQKQREDEWTGCTAYVSYAAAV